MKTEIVSTVTNRTISSRIVVSCPERTDAVTKNGNSRPLAPGKMATRPREVHLFRPRPPHPPKPRRLTARIRPAVGPGPFLPNVPPPAEDPSGALSLRTYSGSRLGSAVTCERL